MEKDAVSWDYNSNLRKSGLFSDTGALDNEATFSSVEDAAVKYSEALNLVWTITLDEGPEPTFKERLIYKIKHQIGNMHRLFRFRHRWCDCYNGDWD